MYTTGPQMLKDALQSWQHAWGDDIVHEAGENNTHLPRDASRNSVTIIAPEYIIPVDWHHRPDVCNTRHAQYDWKACRALHPQAYSVTYCTLWNSGKVCLHSRCPGTSLWWDD